MGQSPDKDGPTREYEYTKICMRCSKDLGKFKTTNPNAEGKKLPEGFCDSCQEKELEDIKKRKS